MVKARQTSAVRAVRRGRLRDPVAQVLVHVAPVLEGTQEYGLGHAIEQVADDVAHQPRAGGIVKHVADHGAGLAPVVVLGVQGLGGVHHLSVGVPARRLAVVHGVGFRAALGVRRVHWVVDVAEAHRAVLAVAVHGRPRGVHRQQVVVRPEAGTVGIWVGEHPASSILSGLGPIPGTRLLGSKAACSISV